MKKIIFLSLCASMFSLSLRAQACSDEAKHSDNESSEALSQKTFGSPIEKAGKNSQILEGTVTDVCHEKGCWMKVKTAKGEKTVRFKDYGFFVPPAIVGKTVRFNAADAKDGKEWLSTGVEVVDASAAKIAR